MGESPGWNFHGPVRATAALPSVIVWIDGWGEGWPEGAVVEDWAETMAVWEKAKGEMVSTTSRASPNVRIAARVSEEDGRVGERDQVGNCEWGRG